MGTLTIRNNENAEIRDVRVSFRVAGYTASEFPCGNLPLIAKGRSAELPLYADFSPEGEVRVEGGGEEVQFPAETPGFRTGNRRDIGLLYAAALEASGISTAIILPGLMSGCSSPHREIAVCPQFISCLLTPNL
jgi:hypothetical protein